jgi:hypothetical protein
LNGAAHAIMLYAAPMSRLLNLSIAVILSLASIAAAAAPVHRHPVPGWHGYGFLPGYHQPPSNALPLFMQKDVVRRFARGEGRTSPGQIRPWYGESRPGYGESRPWYIDPTPEYFGYDGDWHYFGRPGFYGGRYNGGTFGPCYTRTPIGPIWNCG